MPTQLRTLDFPDFGRAQYHGLAPATEFAFRLQSTRQAMLERGWSHLLVYADREHFANLAWITGFEPRFEEAVLLLGEAEPPLLLTGIESAGYLPISPLWQSGGLRHERWDDFSLPGIVRSPLRAWSEIFRTESIRSGSRVGVVGWKQYADATALDVPAYLVDALRATGASLTNGVHIFSAPENGLRTRASASEIALFEWANIEASEGWKSLLRGLRPGATDHQLAALLQYNGSPTGCHWTLKTGTNRISLASPRGDRAERGGTLSANVCYWGANCCRAGWIVESAAELPRSAMAYVDEFAAPYFEAMAGWFARLAIGTPGGELERWILHSLPAPRFERKLNAGHLIHLEEWISTPIFPGSEIPLASGMVVQSDVSPSSSQYFTVRMEDGYALAGAALQQDLGRQFPEVLSRCFRRREFMRTELGLVVSDDVLPLSNLCGQVMPYLLAPQLKLVRG